MFLIITAVFIVGAFAIAGAATSAPLNAWLSHIEATPHAKLGLLPPSVKAPHEIR